MDDKVKAEKVEVKAEVKPVVEVKLSKEERFKKDNAELVIFLQSKKGERTPAEDVMLHALILVDQIGNSLADYQASTSKDPMVIAGLKDGLVEALLELEDARKVYDAEKVKEEKISKIV